MLCQNTLESYKVNNQMFMNFTSTRQQVLSSGIYELLCDSFLTVRENNTLISRPCLYILMTYFRLIFLKQCIVLVDFIELYGFIGNLSRFPLMCTG